MTSSRRLLLVALGVTVLLRVLMLALPPTANPDARIIEPVSDGREYQALARTMTASRVFSLDTAPPFRPELFRTPVYPAFVALTGLPAHGSPLLPVIAQIVLSLLLLLVVRELGLLLGIERRTATLAALLVALSPNLVFLSTKLVTETLFALGLTTCLLLVARFRRSHGSLELIGAGLCSGLLILTRPIAILFPVLLAGYALWRLARARPRRVWLALLPLLAAALVVGPWVVRNGRLTGRYVVSTAADHNTFLYNAATVVAAEQNTSIEEARDLMRAEAEARYGPLDPADEAVFWSRLGQVGREHLLRRPLAAAGIQLAGFGACFATPLSISPLLQHFGVRPGQNTHTMQKLLGLVARGRIGEAVTCAIDERLGGAGPAVLWILGLAALFLGLVLFGLVVGLFSRQGRELRWLLLPVLYFTLLPGPVGDARFRAPIEPCLLLIAAVGFEAVLRRVRERRARQ